MKLLNFYDLQENEVYRALHGGEKDHGYTYTLKNGRLFNTSKNKVSSLGFNKNIKFIKENIKFKDYDTLEFPVEMGVKTVKVGCQSLSIKDAVQLANDLLERYEENIILDEYPTHPDHTFVAEDIPF